MTKQAFLNDLKLSLFGVNESVKDEILADINEHFIEGAAQGLSEEEICKSLGQPGTIAAQVMEEMGSTPPPTPQQKTNWGSSNSDIDQSFANITELKVELEASSLRLHPSTNDMFRVTITNLGDSKHKIEDNNGALRIKVKREKRWFNWSFGESSPKVDVYVPAQFAGMIKAETAAGSIHAQDTTGDLKLESAAGKIVIDNHRCKIAKLSAAAGSIKANFADSILDEVKIESAAGSVKLIVAETKNLKLTSAAGSVTADIQNLSGDAKLDAAAGSIHLTAYKVTGNIKASSAVGSVNITLPADTDIRVEAEQPTMGKLQNNLQGNPYSAYVLRAESSLGSIKINAI